MGRDVMRQRYKGHKGRDTYIRHEGLRKLANKYQNILKDAMVTYRVKDYVQYLKAHPWHLNCTIVTSFDAIANKFTDLPRFGANATSCTGEVMAVTESILEYFLPK